MIAREQGRWFVTSRWRPIRFEVRGKNNMLGQNHRIAAKEGHGAHRVTQFAQITWPVMTKQLLHRFRMVSRDVFAFFSRGSLQFRGNKCRQLFKSFSKRRNKQGKTVESLIQIFSKFSQPHPFSQRTV